MHWSEMITRRRSVRSYTGDPVGEEILEKIYAFAREMVPLHSHIRTAWHPPVSIPSPGILPMTVIRAMPFASVRGF